MDELQISGKRFISSRRIARENGYTSDYIGQLIRGGKVVGQKVGRAWYVDAASFDAYLGEEGSAPVVSTPELVVEPLLQKEEVRVHEELLPEPTPVAIEAAIEEKKVAEAPVEEISLPELSEIVEAEISQDQLLENTVETPVVVEEKEVEESKHVPLRIARAEAKKENGLRYVAEDVPGLPEIRSNKKESRIEAVEEEGEEMIAAPITIHAPRHRNRLPIAALAALGVLIFVFSAVVSSAMSLNLTIHEGNAAATSYSLDW